MIVGTGRRGSIDLSYRKKFSEEPTPTGIGPTIGVGVAGLGQKQPYRVAEPSWVTDCIAGADKVLSLRDQGVITVSEGDNGRHSWLRGRTLSEEHHHRGDTRDSA